MVLTGYETESGDQAGSTPYELYGRRSARTEASRDRREGLRIGGSDDGLGPKLRRPLRLAPGDVEGRGPLQGLGRAFGPVFLILGEDGIALHQQRLRFLEPSLGGQGTSEHALGVGDLQRVRLFGLPEDGGGL